MQNYNIGRYVTTFKHLISFGRVEKVAELHFFTLITLITYLAIIKIK